MPTTFLVAVVCRRCHTPRACTQRPDFCGCGALFHRDSYALIEGELVARGRSIRIDRQIRFVGDDWTDAERLALVEALETEKKPRATHTGKR